MKEAGYPNGFEFDCAATNVAFGIICKTAG